MITAPMYYADDYEAPAPKVCALCDPGFTPLKKVVLEVYQNNGVPFQDLSVLAEQLKTELDKHAS